MDPYINMIQQCYGNIQMINQQIAALAASMAQLKSGVLPGQDLSSAAQIHWPLQQLQGCIEWPKKTPHSFIQSVEIAVDETGFFGETLAVAQGTFPIDKNRPSYMIGLDAGLYQAAKSEMYEGVLNRWRPLSSDHLCDPEDCKSLMDFEWRITYGDDDRLFNTGWLASSLLYAPSYRHPAFVLPAEKCLTNYELVTIQARPLQEAGDGNKFKLFFYAYLYKMYQRGEQILPSPSVDRSAY